MTAAVVEAPRDFGRASVLAEQDVLVEPAFYTCPEYVETLGPEAADFGVLCGRTPNPEQRLLLDGAFGIDKRGRLAAFEVDIVASRQNLKTGFLAFQGLAKACLLRRPLQIWTAHKESATDEAFLDITKMIDESAELSRRVRGVGSGKGSKEIRFLNGARIVFRPRTGKAGQAMSADDINLDEKFAVQPSHLASLVPTLSTRPHAQITSASSAPHAESDYQRAGMRRGRAAARGLTVEPRLLYAEWSVQRYLGEGLDGHPRYGPPSCLSLDCDHAPGAPGCIAESRELIKIANPSVGRSSAPAIAWDFIADERRTMAGAIEEYFRERLGAGDEGGSGSLETVFGVGNWEATAGEPAVLTVPAALGVAVSVDRDWASIAAATLIEVVPEEDPDAEPDAVVFVAAVDRRPGVDWLVAELRRIQTETDCVIVMDEKGPTSTLLDELEDGDVAIETMTLDECAKACSSIYDKVKQRRLMHRTGTELDTAVSGAAWRTVGDRQVWGRRQSVEDVSMLEAATFAAFGAEKFAW